MFNLIVKYAAWTEGRDTFPAERVFEYTADHVQDLIKPEGEYDLPAIQRLPTVFMQESQGNANQVARVGTLTAVRAGIRSINIEFIYDPAVAPIRNEQLQELKGELDIDDWEFTRTHWAVKDVDFFRVLFRNMQPRRQQPTVFDIEDPERIEPTLIAAMMPFAQEFDGVYETLGALADELDLHCRRADNIWNNPAIIQDVVSLIDHAKVVISDCTGRNPNVFYETGIAHALGREVILITQSRGDIPFDLQHLRHVLYLNNNEGLAALREDLRDKIAQLML